MFLYGWDAGFIRGTEQDTRFKFLHDLSDQRKNRQKHAYSCVGLQVMNSNSSVSCQVLSNVSIIA